MLTLLRDADVFAPEPLGRRDLLVGAGRILAMAASLPSLPKLAAAPFARELDLHGMRVIPGLIDAHVHVTGGGGEAGPSSRVPEQTLSSLTSAGVTSCVGLLGTDGTTRSIESLVARTLGLREEGLSAWCWTGSYQLPVRTLTGSVRSDVLFVDPIIGVGELAISDHRSSQPTFDELMRVASDVHVAGLMSGKAGVLHLHVGDGARGLELVRRALDVTELPSRVFHPTHVNRQPALFDEALELAERGCTIDVTAFPPDDGDPAIPAANAIIRYLEAGLPWARLTCSSDSGGCLPTFDRDGRLVKMDVGRSTTLLDAVRTLVAGGVSLDVALAPFTRNVATHLRLAGKGAITVGGAADLVVLDDALEVKDVMARGAWMVRSGAIVRPPLDGRFEKTS